MAAEAMSVSVVVATLRRPDVLESCLRAAITQEPAPHEVLVVDGDPERSAARVVAAVAADARCPVRHLPSAPGLTRQRNVGLDAASGDLVVFVDDDAQLRPGALAELVRAYDDPVVVGASGRVYEPASNAVVGKQSALRRLLPGGRGEGTMTSYGYPRRLVREDIARDIEFLSGCFMSARTERARAVRFDERLSGYGLAEDEDFGYRLSRVGRVRYVPDAAVDHANAGFGSRDRRAFGRTVVLNRAYLFRKNFAQHPRSVAGFCGLIVLLVGHRLANRDLRGVLGILDGAREARAGWRSMSFDV